MRRRLSSDIESGNVLILVLMEDTLRVKENKDAFKCLDFVLILVLMEDTLRAVSKGRYKLVIPSLNPCFNGRYS